MLSYPEGGPEDEIQILVSDYQAAPSSPVKAHSSQLQKVEKELRDVLILSQSISIEYRHRLDAKYSVLKGNGKSSAAKSRSTGPSPTNFGKSARRQYPNASKTNGASPVNSPARRIYAAGSTLPGNFVFYPTYSPMTISSHYRKNLFPVAQGEYLVPPVSYQHYPLPPEQVAPHLLNQWQPHYTYQTSPIYGQVPIGMPFPAQSPLYYPANITPSSTPVSSSIRQVSPLRLNPKKAQFISDSQPNSGADSDTNTEASDPLALYRRFQMPEEHLSSSRRRRPLKICTPDAASSNSQSQSASPERLEDSTLWSESSDSDNYLLTDSSDAPEIKSESSVSPSSLVAMDGHQPTDSTSQHQIDRKTKLSAQNRKIAADRQVNDQNDNILGNATDERGELSKERTTVSVGHSYSDVAIATVPSSATLADDQTESCSTSSNHNNEIYVHATQATQKAPLETFETKEVFLGTKINPKDDSCKEMRASGNNTENNVCQASAPAKTPAAVDETHVDEPAPTKKLSKRQRRKNKNKMMAIAAAASNTLRTHPAPCAIVCDQDLRRKKVLKIVAQEKIEDIVERKKHVDSRLKSIRSKQHGLFQRSLAIIQQPQVPQYILEQRVEYA